MIKYTLVLPLSIAFCAGLSAQTITGNLTQLKSQTIRLEGFVGLKTYPISNTSIDTSGKFTLNYSKTDYGVGYLISADEKPLFAILSGEDIELQEALSDPETLRIRKGTIRTRASSERTGIEYLGCP